MGNWIDIIRIIESIRTQSLNSFSTHVTQSIRDSVRSDIIYYYSITYYTTSLSQKGTRFRYTHLSNGWRLVLLCTSQPPFLRVTLGVGSLQIPFLGQAILEEP